MRAALASIILLSLTASLGLVSCGGDDSSGGSANDVCVTRELTLDAEGVVTPAIPPAPDDELASAIASSFCGTVVVTDAQGEKVTTTPNPSLTPDEATCIGEGLVKAVGPTRLRQVWLLAGPGPWPWDVLGFALHNNLQPGRQPHTIQRAEAETIVDTFKSCSKGWELLLIMGITEGAQQMSAKSAECASERLTDDDARTIFIGEIDRAYDDPLQPEAQSFANLVRPVVDAFDECLTPEELDRIDWN